MAFDIETIGAALACGAGSSGGSSNSYVDASKIVNTASGSTVNIFDASGNGIDEIDFYGDDIKQKSYTGKNLLNLNGLKEHYHDGVTYTPVHDDNGYLLYINVNGKTESGTSYYDLVKMTIPAGTYIFSQGYHPELSNIGLIIEWGEFPDDHAIRTWYGDGQDCRLTYTFDSDTEILIAILASEYDDNVNLYPMIRLDDIKYYDDYEYEPYTGSKVSPNPDYPQPIESKIVNRVDMLGKNLLNENGLSIWTHNGITFTPVYENGLLKHINVNGTATANAYYTCKSSPIKSGNYVLSGFENPSSNIRSYINSGGFEIASDVRDNGNFNLASDADVTFVMKVSNGTVVNNVKCHPMIRLASITDGTYEPYQSQTVDLPEPIKLNGIGGVRDTIEIYSDGTGKYIQRIGKIVANKNTRFNTLELSTLQRVLFTIPNMLNLSGRNADVLSSHFVASIEGTIYTMFHAGTEIYLYVGVNNTTDFNSFIADKEITFYYPLAEPIETELPQADIDVIKQLHTYKPNTLVMNDAAAEMTVHYEADAKTYIDNKFNELAKAIVNE